MDISVMTGRSGKPIRFQSPSMPVPASIFGHFQLAMEAKWFSNFGPCVHELEERMSKRFFDGRKAVTASNATLGLLLSMRSAFGMPSAERRFVAVPSFTFIASIGAIRWAGFEPLFVDVDPDDWQVSHSSLKEVLEKHRGQVAGVMLTTTFGTPLIPSKARALSHLVSEHNLRLIVDAAAALGTSNSGTGTDAEYEIYSLHATKPYAVGEGAVIACRTEEAAAVLRSLTNFGFDSDRNLNGMIGLNAKMPEIIAAVGLAVLQEFDQVILQRRSTTKALVPRLEECALTAQVGYASSVFQFVPLLACDSSHRDEVSRCAAERRIETRSYFSPAMHQLREFERARRVESLAATEMLASQVICFPMANDVPPDFLERCIEVAGAAAP